jgi:hypothetical protein
MDLPVTRISIWFKLHQMGKIRDRFIVKEINYDIYLTDIYSFYMKHFVVSVRLSACSYL